MSSEESDDDFQSADEDIEFEPINQKAIQLKDEDSDQIQLKINKDHENSDLLVTEVTHQLNLKSDVEETIGSIISTKHMDKEIIEPLVKESDQELDLKSMEESVPKDKIFSQLESQTEKANDLITNERVDKSDTKEEKTVIKGRKLMRKADRLKGQTSGEEPQIPEEKNEVKDSVQKSLESVTNEEVFNKIESKTEKRNDLTEDKNNTLITTERVDKSDEKEEKTVIIGRKLLRKSDRLKGKTCVEEPQISEEKKNEMQESVPKVKVFSKIEPKTEERNDFVGKLSLKSSDESLQELIPKEKVFTQIDSQIEKRNDLIEDKNNTLITNERVEKSDEKEEKTLIKGRKLMRKADRLKGEASGEDTQISEEKKNEVLNKLANLTEKDDNISNWNNWFSDIKSAAKTATSTTVSHVSQASNKWSFDPKSLLSSAATITSTVGSGISSVVDNVSSVMDSAIGAPPPEQLAALVNMDSKLDNNSECNKDTKIGENQSKSGFGFGLFDYTFNTLESIGKKTIEVIKVEERHNPTKPQTRDKMD